MQTISGRVVVKGTGFGITDLLVVIEDSRRGDEGFRSSRITDRDGGFEFALEAIPPNIKLRLKVLAADEPSNGPAVKPIYEARELRRFTGAIEQYLIQLSAEDLARANIPLPTDPAAETESSQRAVERMTGALRSQTEILEETRRAAVAEVAKARERRTAIESVVEERLMEVLTGVKAREAADLNILLPGQKVEPLAWKVANESLRAHVNQRRAISGYIVLDAATARRFQNADGSYRTNIGAAEIEPLLFGSGDPAARRLSLRRETPNLADGNGDLSDIFSGEGEGSPVTTAASPPPPSVPVSPAEFDLDRLVERLAGPIAAPEQFGIFSQPTRANDTDVDARVQGLSLRSGPADVPAHYQFHSLQIAFDHVWQKAVDEGVLELGRILAAKLADQGGDAVAALSNPGDPIAALRREVRDTSAAMATLAQAGISLQPKRKLAPNQHSEVSDAVETVTEAVRDSPDDLLGELTGLLNERYRFDVFAPGSSNFGLMVTYDQEWRPITYQAGSLVKTLTLAPKETRKVSVRRTVKKERSVKEIEANQSIRKDESSETMRDEAEIVQKAQHKSNFAFSAKGSYNALFWSGEVSANLTLDADISSQETKRAFREAVLKAAQEFKDERKLEVETKDIFDEEATESSEMTNPNDELTCTYLFYELQRLYDVSQAIKNLTPVVMVALEVPNPDRRSIDQVLVTHSWIINRVLLDDRYRPALEYLRTRMVGDQRSLGVQINKIAALRLTVEHLRSLHRSAIQLVIDRDILMQNARSRHAIAVGNDEDSEDIERERLVREGAAADYDRSVREERDVRLRLEAESGAYTAACDAYAIAYAEHINRMVEITGLRLHFKENVLYYMQAIWSFIFRDQLFFSLYKIQVPRLKVTEQSYSLSEPDEPPLHVIAGSDDVVLEVTASHSFDTEMTPENDKVTLAEIADLDRPLGFKGNYIIFPMKKSNALTDYMMIPYIDTVLGLHDPDEGGSWTPATFAEYARDYYRRQESTLSEDLQKELKQRLRLQYRRIAENAQVIGDRIAVPTASLFIEAMPGTHPLLEDFKLAHRIIDVKKAQAETRKIEMENLRFAARIFADKFEDPDIERKIVIEGAAGPVIVPPEA
jgi:hypothetical protein